MVSVLRRNFYVIGIIYALIALVIFPKWTIDDAYIIYRYADNLAKYGELTWNVGQDPIEGYTGLVLPVILALFIKLGLSPVLMGKIIGIGSYFLGGLLLALALKKLEVSDLARSIALLLYFTAPFSFSHAWGGLETTLYSAMLMMCTYLLLNVVTSRQPRQSAEIWLCVALLFTSLVRPEAALLAGISFLAILYIKRRGRKGDLRAFVIRFILIYAIPGLIYFLWRWQYYGQLFPNPFYVKSNPGLISKGSLLSLALFTIYYLLIPTLVCLAVYLTHPRRVRERLSERYFSGAKSGVKIALLAILAFAVLIYLQYLRSRLLINFEFRFFAQYYPIFLLFVGAFLSAGCGVLQEKGQNVAKIWIGLLVAIQLAVNVAHLNKYRFLRSAYEDMITQEHIPAGLFVRESVPPEEWLIVVHDAGAIPYYARHKTVDFGRLNNEYLLQKKLSQSDILDYFFSFNAGAVVMTSFKWNEVSQLWIFGREAEQIVHDPRFDRYVLVKKYKTDAAPGSPSSEYFEFLFLRKNLYAAWNSGVNLEGQGKGSQL